MKNKHDHKGTKILKIGIFSTLMLAPFMAVLFKCCYVTFNKNAKDSYGGMVEPLYTSNVVNSDEDLELGNIYTYTLTEQPSVASGYINVFQASAIYNFTSQQYVEIDSSSEIRKYSVRFYSNKISILNSSNSNELFSALYTNISYPFSFQVVLYNLQDTTTYATYEHFSYTDFNIYENQYNAQSTLDNAFYYAIDEAMDSPYFAWARTSALYTATSGLTTGMGITTQAVPTLIVYWLILTAIYIIIDIVIESFTYLTHCIMNRFE